MTISLCMIVKDEEQVLARCLDSVKDCVDEIVIVDTGSTDGTRELAKRYTQKLFSFRWIEDFSAARNYALERATGDYLLWLDADDFLPPESAERLRQLKETLQSEKPDLVFCPYDMGDRGDGKPALTFFRERILRREANFKFRGRVHECIAARGKQLHADVRVVHLGSAKERSYRNLNIYLRWAEEETLSGRDLYYFGRELYYHKLYTQAIAVLNEMLRGDGWYVNKIAACKVLADCYLSVSEKDRALTALLRSFTYGEPRAFILCDLAKIFMNEKKYREAIYWYQTALSCRDHSKEGDFEEPACRDLIPLLQLVVCCYACGDTAAAKLWHERAEEKFPNHPSVLFNRKFFQAR